MHLYNLTLEKAGQIVCSVTGNFSSSKAQEIVVSKGKVLSLLRPDENGKIQTINEREVFGQIRSLAAFRLTGGSKDYLIVGSDSGRIVILEYSASKERWEKVHQETYGKSGCRRIVPGQYLATDPKGRAVMIGAVEKQKFVYVLNRDTNAKLTINSPKEAHKNNTVCYGIVGLEMGFENPIFASLEVTYDEDNKAELQGEDVTGPPSKHIVFYELDLGLNHVVRKSTQPVDATAGLLVAMPEGPGGVLVCSENYVTWINQNQNPVRCPIPRRMGVPSTQSVVIASAVYVFNQKSKENCFFLLQSEYGDLYKLSFSATATTVKSLSLDYFDTIPVSTSLNFLKSGYLFSAAETGPNCLYEFQGLGDNKDPIVQGKNDSWTYFLPRGLKNLLESDRLDSLAPLTDIKVGDVLKEGTSQVFATSGRGREAAVRVLRHGLGVAEVACSTLPGIPSSVWTAKASSADTEDKFIVASFANATFVLAIGETVEEAKDSGLLTNTPTLHVGNMGKDSVVQVHSGGWRFVRNNSSSNRAATDWKPSGKKTVVHACSNTTQLAVALSGGDIVYFEVDSVGQLAEMGKTSLGREIACMALAPVPSGRVRARFLAVGDWDKAVRLLALDPQELLEKVAAQTVTAPPESVALAVLPTAQGAVTYLCIGLNSGVLLRATVDELTGELSDSRALHLGAKPVRFARLVVKGAPALLAISSRCWLLHPWQGRVRTVPLSSLSLDWACHFASAFVPEGIVGIAGNTLRILVLDKLGDAFNRVDIPLLHTARRMVVHPDRPWMLTIETDHNAVNSETFEKLQWNPDKKNNNNKNNNNDNEEEEDEEEDERVFGEPRAGKGQWASAIRVIDATTSSTVQLLELGQNEAAFSLCTCTFTSKENETFVVVGGARDVILTPRSVGKAFVNVYRLQEGKGLHLLHTTDVDDIPTALCAFQGRLLVAVGPALRLYELGKKKLLLKCENKGFPTFITALQALGSRVYVADAAESVHFVTYKKRENQLHIFADDAVPRALTSLAVLDYNTVAGADKFGNIFVARLNGQISEEIDDYPLGIKNATGYLNGAPHRLEPLANFHVGETVTSLAKASLAPNATEALVYATLSGSLGVLVPFANREDLDFFSHLEMYMRQEHPPLCGRDHISYRSAYFPVKDVIDGDLCEQFADLELDVQTRIAEELERTPAEVIKKLEDIRNKLM